ncbi:S-adenosyl-L-methionine-dependent methyltransferase [Mycena albidolilacea]|uniref:rRNA adenine N(6)-methyltransferase n=1 Tax=Mycena albidolilacea TaxID=1033008 RepID=A0AAD7ERC2_9AGAR|nr:S-adenosyl-L-methionine-dependent methyltransferase [Mycena albidolilacea]
MLCINHARRKTVALSYRLYRTHAKVILDSVNPDDLTLPPRPLWKQYFPMTLKPFPYRVTLANPTTAAEVANAFIPENSVDKVVVEIFPGPGQLTRALLALPRSRIKKLIVLENADMYLKYLKPLEAADDRIKVVALNGESWASYQRLEDMNLLDDIQTIPWDKGVHPQLHFVSHLMSNVYGEQFISQLFRGMPDQQWLFKYGRVPMSLLMSDYIWKRVQGDTVAVRCKLSMIAAAVASCEEAIPFEALQPYAEHFYPPPSGHTKAMRNANIQEAKRKAGTPFAAINVTPLEQQVIQPGLLDKWDYCLRHLYVNRATAIKKALPYLAPNAQSLLKGTDIDPKTHVRELTISDWTQLVTAFHAWPFAPADLSITDTIGIDDERRG